MKKVKNQSAQQEPADVQGNVKPTPVHQVKYPFSGGLITAAVWLHTNKHGNPWYSVSFSRAYKDSESGDWKYGDRSYSRDELLCLSAIISKVYQDIVSDSIQGGNANE